MLKHVQMGIQMGRNGLVEWPHESGPETLESTGLEFEGGEVNRLDDFQITIGI